jgi:simple sugar transport system permease protein
LATVAALAAAWIAFDVLVWAYGESPYELAAMLLRGTWGTAYGAAQVIYKATPLLFAGVAVDVALRGGLFNIGGEGQVAVAGLAAGALGASLPASLPAPLSIVSCTLAGVVAGAAWAAPPAFLRARLGVHEVISTIMMNRIAGAAVAFALASGLALKGSQRTADVVSSARLVRLDVLVPMARGTAASAAFPVAMVCAFAVPWAARRTRLVREITLVGMNRIACRAEGIPVGTRLAQALLLSGGIAGLVSLATVLGYKGHFEAGLGAGAGFGGIAVALVGKGSGLGMIGSALLFGTLEQGGLAINAFVPMESMQVLEGVIILAVALADARVREWLSASSGKRAAA